MGQSDINPKHHKPIWIIYLPNQVLVYA